MATPHGVTFNPREFYDDAADSYAKVWHDVPVAHTSGFAGRAGTGGVVLDVAAGSGRDLSALAAAGLTAIGCDLAANQCRHASGHGPVIQADHQRLPFAAATFDGIWAWAAVVHAADMAALSALVEFRRCAKAGATLFVSVKTRDDTVGSDGRDSAGRWFRIWPPDTFAAIVEYAGWRIEERTVESCVLRDTVDWLVISATAV